MPKVSEKYVNSKKNQILDAALEVFIRKPVFAVTMQDVIDQMGFSQGAIYRYFNDIDDIIIAIHNRSFSNIDYRDKLEAILSQKCPPEEIMRQAFSCLAQYINESSGLFNKIRFELLMLYQAYPKRGKKIQEGLNVKESNSFALESAISFAMKQVEIGYFKPIMPLEKIASFVSFSCDGILFDDMLFKNTALYEQPPIKSDVTELFSTLCDLVIIMLGGDKHG